MHWMGKPLICLLNTSTIRFWSLHVHFHIAVVQILAVILAIVLNNVEEKLQNGGHNLFYLVVFTLLQRLPVFAIDHK